MQWIAISGSWRTTSEKVEQDVRREVACVLKEGNGIVTGGALNVDYFAVDEALKHDPGAKRIKVFLPTTLDIYAAHYRKRAKEGVITHEQAESLIEQLSRLKEINSVALIENQENTEVTKETYFERNLAVLNAADEFIAFHVNNSEGVQDTIDKADRKGMLVKIYTYSIY